MRTSFLLLSLLFYCIVSEAQTKTVTGTVKDQAGEWLSGAMATCTLLKSPLPSCATTLLA